MGVFPINPLSPPGTSYFQVWKNLHHAYPVYKLIIMLFILDLRYPENWINPIEHGILWTTWNNSIPSSGVFLLCRDVQRAACQAYSIFCPMFSGCAVLYRSLLAKPIPFSVPCSLDVLCFTNRCLPSLFHFCPMFSGCAVIYKSLLAKPIPFSVRRSLSMKYVIQSM